MEGCWNVGLGLPLKKSLAAREGAGDLGLASWVLTPRSLHLHGVICKQYSVTWDSLLDGCRKGRPLLAAMTPRQYLKLNLPLEGPRGPWQGFLAQVVPCSGLVCPAVRVSFCCLQPRTPADAMMDVFHPRIVQSSFLKKVCSNLSNPHSRCRVTGGHRSCSVCCI